VDKHYLQTTDEHYARAHEEGVRNPVQQPAARVGVPSQFPDECDGLLSLAITGMAEAGLEPARPVRGTGF
jgi:hypothetical protein